MMHSGSMSSLVYVCGRGEGSKLSALPTSSSSLSAALFYKQSLEVFGRLCALDNFASGRDVQTLYKSILGRLLKTSKSSRGPLTLTERIVLEEIEKMLTERTNRARATSKLSANAMHGVFTEQKKEQPPHLPTRRQHAITKATPATKLEQEQQAGAKHSATTKEDDTASPEDGAGSHRLAVRDAGVSDEVWNQLQMDKKREEDKKREAIRLKEEEARLREWLKKCADAKRQRELDEIERKRKELEEKLKQEAMEREKLMQIGRCPMGYDWIRQSGGYRCAGGSHWVSDGDMKALCG